MATAQDHYGRGNEAFVAENYAEAVEHYAKAIVEDETRDDFYSSRAHANIKLENFIDAVADATKAIELNPKNSKAFLRKGVASFHLEEYESAKQSFNEGLLQDESNKNFPTWISKCEENLKLEGTASSAKDSTKKTDEDEKPAVIPMPSGPKTRFDWYQTETHVIVTVLIKNVKKEDISSIIEKRSLSVTIRLENGTDYSLELDLAHPIDENKSTLRIMSTKVEIKLKKMDGIRWNKLEGADDATKVKQFKPDSGGADKPPTYPSSSHHTRDWDKVVADIKEEEKTENLEGDAALNNLFQQIYRDGSDEVRKAMNKSFTESAGTVLSTNWADIGKKEVDVKPPDGMEYKEWEN